VRAGRVPETVVTEAARRVLRTKMRLGLFDRPDIDPTRVDSVFPSPETRKAAREVARETLVLLQNRDNVLPVASNVRSIAVIGPLADSPRDHLGPHAARGHDEDTVTILQGIRQRAQAAGIRVEHAPACDQFCRNADQLPAAVAAAQASDLVIAVFGEPQELSGEAASRAYMTLNGKQAEILEALSATGKPVALVVVGGRPLVLGALPDRVPAILMAWYPGTEGGSAVADVLFGDVNPSARLPVTWPRAVGQVPIYYNRLPTGRPTLEHNRFTLKYIDEAITPLFPFGWGLSYTTFAYKDAAIGKPRLTPGETLDVSVTVTNTGSRQGQEVVQLYMRDPVASRSRPLRQLKAFEKIALQPGESKVVRLQIPVEELGFHLDDGTYVVEAGDIEVFVGGNSLAGSIGRVEITDTVRIPPPERRASASPALLQ
jgi:beta-glucosidase